MATTQLKLRSDLEFKAESAAPDSSVIVKDPIARRFYRFSPVQASVLRQLDGIQDPALIASIVSEKLGTIVLTNQVEEFAGKLQGLCLLDHPACWAKLEKAGRRSHRILKNILSIKIHAFNPDQFLGRLDGVLNFCFSGGFAIVVCTAFFIALAILFSNWRTVLLSAETLLSISSIPLILLVISSVMTIHECAHGLALKHFGGKVEEMGFLVLYLIPAFYCNVSDAWMLKKRERIWVTLAGSYIQVFIWSLAVIGWRLLAEETLASRVFLIIIAVSGLQTLLNFIPLIRLDGYYLLSDYIEVPNLRPRAFSYLKSRISESLTGIKAPEVPSPARRERRIYWIYGVASFIFTATVIWLTLRRLGGWMIQQYQTWGVVLLAILFLTAIPAARKENWAASGKFLGRVATRFGKAPLFWILLCLIVFIGFIPWELKITGDFVILPTNQVSVSPQVEGTLKAILVDQGSRVHVGDVLAEMENLDLTTSYEETKGELAAQRASLELLKAGTRPEEISRAKLQIETKITELNSSQRIEEQRKVLADTVAKKESELQNAALNYQRSQRLVEEGLIARNEVDRDRTAFEVQQGELAEAKGQLKVLEEQTDRTRQIKTKELAQARSELNILMAGSRKESIDALDAQVKKLEEKANILSQQLQQLKIQSPIEGVVSTPYLRNRVGDYLEKGNMFCSIVSEGVVIIEMPVPEKEIADVAPGFPITMRVRGFPSRPYEAKVKELAPVALDLQGVKKIVVQGELANSDGNLKAGMTGVGKILCGKKPIAELATRRMVRWLRTEFWEYLP
jgi:putative peptide zinc metalloprotease protein